MKDKYLKRIGLPSVPSNSEAGLFDLHRSQAFSLPFENLTVLLGEHVSLEPDALSKKILSQKRGGYCFELNGLFAWAAKEFCFDFQVHLARVQVQNPEPGPLTHQMGIAKVSGRDWLCDVGFGGPSIRYPMPLELDRVEIQDGEAFRLTMNPDFGYGLQQRQADGSWFPLYFFQRTRIQPIDITMANHFTSTWEQAIFRKWPMCAKPFSGGKHTLMGRELKMRRGAAVEVKKLGTAIEFISVLREIFEIELDLAQTEKLSAIFDRLP